MTQPVDYPSQELEIFREALHWKRYFGRCLAPYLAGDVLEVGAGIGATSRVLCRPEYRSWTCLEPDTRLFASLEAALGAQPLPAPARARLATLESLESADLFDSILYVDVLEHIERDRAELAAAERRLREGGRLVVLAPAHSWLYSEFDRAIGHFRRYSAQGLAAIAPRSLRRESLFYLDSAGVLASVANRCLLRTAQPTPAQIQFWDRYLVSVSRMLDPCLGFRLGKSVVGVWRKGPLAPGK